MTRGGEYENESRDYRVSKSTRTIQEYSTYCMYMYTHTCCSPTSHFTHVLWSLTFRCMPVWPKHLVVFHEGETSVAEVDPGRQVFINLCKMNTKDMYHGTRGPVSMWVWLTKMW